MIDRYNDAKDSILILLFIWRRKHHTYNISGILNGLQVGYDKRVRPNYGGEF